MFYQDGFDYLLDSTEVVAFNMPFFSALIINGDIPHNVLWSFYSWKCDGEQINLAAEF